jgi:hypothetical protein
MAVCPTCQGEMMEGISCLPDPIRIGDEFFEPIRWGAERENRGSVVDVACRDCATPPGGVHHPGCCLEQCPACRGQALGCPCFGDPDADAMPFDRRGDTCPHHGRTRTRCGSHIFPRRRRS